jgi:Ca-activated chloride channel family protein
MKLTWAFAATAAGLTLLAALAAIPLATQPPPPAAAVPAAQPFPVPVAAPLPLTQPPQAATATAGALTLKARLSSSYVIAGSSEVHAVMEVQAAQLAAEERHPVNLAVVIDRSGSMMGEKLAAAKLAATSLVDQLGPRDRLAIVHYGSEVESLPSQLATADGKEQMRLFIAGIPCSGSTDIGLALHAAADLVGPVSRGYGSNRIILITDGQPTTGLMDPPSLERLAAEIHHQGIAVTALGVGSDFNETLMRAMAESGAGFYGYIADASQLEGIFSRELHQATAAVARNVEVRLDLAPGVELIDILGRPSTVDGRTAVTSLYDLSSGLSAQFVARLRVTAPDVRGTVPIVGVRLSYVDAKTQAPQKTELALSAEVTDRQEVVLAHADPDVETRSLHAVGSKEIARATEEFRTGNRTGALAIMDNVRLLFGSSSNALAGDVHQVDAARAQLMNARTPDEIAAASKSVQKRNLSNFGSNLDTY